jgi:hypothetical protein
LIRQQSAAAGLKAQAAQEFRMNKFHHEREARSIDLSSGKFLIINTI